MKDKQKKNGSERQQIFGPLEKSKPRSGNHRKRTRAVSTVSPHSHTGEEQQFSNTDEIAAESADAVDETEDYAGLEDVEPGSLSRTFLSSRWR